MIQKFFGPATLFFMTATLLVDAQTKAVLNPLDFQDESIPETLVRRVDQLEARGRNIVIRSENDYLIEMDGNGRFLRTIGPVDWACPAFVDT